MKRALSAAFIAIILLLPGLPAEGGEIKKDFHETFDVSEKSQLRLKHGDGDVTILPWDKDILDVKVQYRAEDKSIGVGGERDFDCVFKQKGSVIEVIGKEKSSHYIGFHYFVKRKYTYTIHAPSYIELELHGDDGDVEITDWRGDIKCELDDGDIDLVNVSSRSTGIQIEDGDISIEGQGGRLSIDGEDGDVVIVESTIPSCSIQLEDGDVRIKRSEGNFDVDVDDGSIRLHKLSAGRLDISTGDGNVDVDLLKAGELDVDINTDDGNVTLELEHGTSATFTIDVDDGSIKIDLPSAKKVEKSRHWMSGEIRDGGGRIKISTADGDVTLKEYRK